MVGSRWERGEARVVWVVHYPIFGGPHNRILRLFPRLQQQGIRVTAVLPSEPGNAVERLREAGVPVVSLPLGRARATRDPRVHMRWAWNFRRDIREIRGVVRATAADALIVGGLINVQGPVAARLEGLAVVWQILDSRTPKPLATALMPVVDRLADTVTFAGQSLVDAHPGADRLRVPTMVSTPGVDHTKFQPSDERRASTRRTMGIPDDALVVGSVANVNRQKGIEFFIRAAAQIEAAHPGARFLVVGASSATHAPYHARLRAEISASGLPPDRLMFAGDQTNVEEWYPAMDVKLMTSVPRSEGTPTTILEAWSCAVPVVATKVGAVDRLIEDGHTGFIVPPCDPGAIAGRTIRLLRDPDLRARMGAAGRREVEARYTLTHVAEVHATAVRQALAGREARLRHGSRV